MGKTGQAVKKMMNHAGHRREESTSKPFLRGLLGVGAIAPREDRMKKTVFIGLLLGIGIALAFPQPGYSQCYGYDGYCGPGVVLGTAGAIVGTAGAIVVGAGAAVVGAAGAIVGTVVGGPWYGYYGPPVYYGYPRPAYRYPAPAYGYRYPYYGPRYYPGYGYRGYYGGRGYAYRGYGYQR
jgi:hypothetical protein